jgi:hypothetical protein
MPTSAFMASGTGLRSRQVSFCSYLPLRKEYRYWYVFPRWLREG